MQVIDEFITTFVDEVFFEYMQHKQDVYLKQEMLAVDAPLIYTSTKLGSIDRHGFHPSLPLLDLLGTRSERKIVVNDKTAWLFICGNNVLKEGIISRNCDEGLVLVVNQRDEVLGYGKITGAGITNKLDKGDYLRRER